MNVTTQEAVSGEQPSRFKTIAIVTVAIALIVAVVVIVALERRRNDQHDHWTTDEYLASINHPTLNDYRERERAADASKRRVDAAQVSIFGHTVESMSKLTTTEQERFEAATAEQQNELLRATRAWANDLIEQKSALTRLQAAREANEQAARMWYINLDEASAIQLHKRRSERRQR